MSFLRLNAVVKNIGEKRIAKIAGPGRYRRRALTYQLVMDHVCAMIVCFTLSPLLPLLPLFSHYVGAGVRGHQSHR